MARLLVTLLFTMATAHLVGSEKGTTPNLEAVFKGRCYDYSEVVYKAILPMVSTSCDDLWTKFFQAFSFRAPCDVRADLYTPFLQAGKQSLPSDKVLFWSGVYALSHRFAENGIRYVTLEDTLIGYLANSLSWCGQEIAPGMNYSRCPSWEDCPSEASESFWAGASRTFGSEARGNVTVMVDGSNPNKPAYRRTSFFAKYELPGLNKTLVKAVNVIVAHDLSKPKLEVCGAGSLIYLQQDVEAAGFTFTCVDDPDSVIHLLCADDPTSRECQLVLSHINGQLTDMQESSGFNNLPDIFQ
ncbi:ADP-ribosyl cyclase/cyclic ADP-ribose hydrolase-like [Physella acuta]|uniref:ADP-ribosyl cyclase/cyclic ADP-ribose hydrolase-like n=1 Tax=Physella acuta TaxID=109671 RepID=UPI0027DE7619|nr:ADP-ribosyl cyclase/cyclic ADP-ribose hydrolase-like [Physella acuta]